MGFVKSLATKLTAFFKKDKEQAAAALATGSTNNAAPSDQRDIMLGLGSSGLLADRLLIERDLGLRYAEYEEMDDYPAIATALDIFADDASQPDTQVNRVVWIEGDDEIKTILDDDLFQRRLRIDEDIWEIARTLCKYGSDFEEILLAEDGVVGLNFLPSPTMRRVENNRGVLLGFIQDFREDFRVDAENFLRLLELKRDKPDDYRQVVEDPAHPFYHLAVFEPWEILHFRLRSKYRRSVYGYAILEPARWIWRRLTLLEDSAILYRLTKAIERYAFYIDVGDMPPAEAYAYVNKIRQQYKKKKFINPTTGKLELKFDPLSQDEDLFIPSRGGQDSTRVETMAAPQWQHMDDIEYFRGQMLGALKVPAAYIAAEVGTTRSILSNEDVRFARTILRVQRALKNGFHKLCRIHLAAIGIDPAAVQFEIRMTVPSAIFELAQLEVRNARADLAARMADFVSLRWILINVFHLSAEEAQVVMDERSEDAVRNAVAAGKGEAAAQKLMMAASGGPAEESRLPTTPEEARQFFTLKALHERNLVRARMVGNASGGNKTALEHKAALAKINTILENDQDLNKRLQNLSRLVKDIHVTLQQPVRAKRSRS